jgi:ABC-type transport system substrate-binding protein
VAPGYGGTYTEGVVGQPRFINPVYGETNDIDRTLIDLVYSGLMTYDKSNKIVNDLVKSYQISDNGKIYTFQLKDNLKWQDGVALTVDDVIYTIKTIQNSDYKSPLRANWLNVDVEKVSNNSFTLSLNAPYNSFLENCTVKIIPQHIWKNVLAENFSLSSFNLQPIGSGPYTLNNLKQNNTGFISSIGLIANNRYYGKVPYISNIKFNFFQNKDGLIKAANQKTIDGFSVSSIDDNELLAEKEITQGWSENEKFNVYAFSLPRYFAVFFNNGKARVLSDTNIAKALNRSVDKKNLIKQISTSKNDKISVVDSPILPEYYGYENPTIDYSFNTDEAGKLFDKSGYKKNDAGQRVKTNTKKPAFQFRSYLKKGSSGTEVTELQGCLSRLDNNFKTILSGETNGKYGSATENAVTEFQKKYLPETKPTGETGPGTRTKLNELCLSPQNNNLQLQFTLTTINQPQLVKVANILKDDWQKMGVLVNIKAVGISELKEIIKTRDYDALLYGQALGFSPDLYPFWHSTQISDPGLNLAEYQNKSSDQLLRDAREATDEDTKKQKLEQLQNVILADAPALFLYNPDYLYWVSGKIKGIETTKIVDPAKRFENISNWYINTHRVFK